MRLEVYTPSTLHQLREPWEHLAAGSDMTAFQRWDWNAVVTSQVRGEWLARRGAAVRYLLVAEAGHPVLIAPIRIQHLTWSPALRRGCYFLGHTSSSDYLDFVYRDFRPDALELVLDHLRRRYAVRSCSFDRILADSPSARYLMERRTSRITEENAVALTIPQTSQEYHALLSRRFRQNVRTARNRAATDDVGLSVEIDEVLTDRDHALIGCMRRSRAASRSSRRSGVSTLLGLYRRMLWGRRPVTAEDLTSVGGTWTLAVRNSSSDLIAFAGGLRDERHGVPTLRVNVVTYDERWSRYSPGIVGLYAAVLQTIEDGLPWRVLDLTRGEEQYKFDLGGRTHAYVSVTCSL
jgi:hypothetical protein